MEEQNQDKIEISLDDLQREEPTDSGRLVITGDDLLDVPDTPVFASVPPPASGGTAPGVGPMPYVDKGRSSGIASSNLLQNLLAGAVGGLLAWAIIEPLFNESATSVTGRVLVEMGLFGGLMGALIGLALGAVEGIMNRVSEKAMIGGAIGLAIGFGGGFLGGVVGQVVYSVLGGGGAASIGQQVLARAIGWGVVGTFVGLGQGIAIRSKRKIVNALLGGLIGGAIGGGLFDFIGMAVGGGTASRAVAITVLGACAGAAIGLVEELRKQAWLDVVEGWLTGKQFIIYKDVTTIGSASKCDIAVFKDPRVMPEHAVIRAENGRYSIHSTQGNAPTYVNRQSVGHRVLRNGDLIGIGGTVFRYSEKAAEWNQH